MALRFSCPVDLVCCRRIDQKNYKKVVQERSRKTIDIFQYKVRDVESQMIKCVC